MATGPVVYAPFLSGSQGTPVPINTNIDIEDIERNSVEIAKAQVRLEVGEGALVDIRMTCGEGHGSIGVG